MTSTEKAFSLNLQAGHSDRSTDAEESIREDGSQKCVTEVRRPDHCVFFFFSSGFPNVNVLIYDLKIK